jgi:hypothetical protein
MEFDDNIVISLLLGFILLTVFTVLLFRRNKDPYRQLAKSLETYQRSEARNIIIPDGIGGLIEIERLLLLEQGLLLIKTYESDGHVFGGNNIDNWTEIVNGRSYKFQNPLPHMETSLQAVSLLMPGIPIYYRIVFLGKSTFPKGIPEQVSHLSGLSKDLAFLSTKPKLGDKLSEPWQRLLRIARRQ